MSLKQNIFLAYRAHTIKKHQLTYLFWECTLRCNLNCRHCGSDCKKEASIPDMEPSLFLKALDEIKQQVDPHTVMICITGGEPLLRNDLESVGKEITARGFPWGIVTNGMLLTSERFSSLLRAGLRSVSGCLSIRARDFVQGNITSENFMDIWNTRFANMRDHSWAKVGKCEHCASWKYCLGNGLHLHSDAHSPCAHCNMELLEKKEEASFANGSGKVYKSE